MKRLFAESSRASTSAAAVSFAEDIVIEILLRLPAKSLLRFKCVCKRWRSLISDPDFAKSHLQRLKAGDIISSQRIFKSSPLETIDYELLDGGIGGEVVKVHQPMDAPRWTSVLVGSCNGLVCLSVSDGFVLYNPTTKESRNFPSSDLSGLDDWLYGFGYDSRSDDYKIVELYSFENWKVAIFSLKSGSWRPTQAQLQGDFSLYERRDGVYWNGALHWCFTHASKGKEKTVIISFDLSEEKYQQVLTVPEVEVDRQIHFEGLGIHGANLFIYHSSRNNCINAWIMSEYGKGGSWTKLFSVSEGIARHGYWWIPIAYTRSGKIVFQIDGDEMILFNPEDNTHKDYLGRRGWNGDVPSTVYVETLVSPYLCREPSRI